MEQLLSTSGAATAKNLAARKSTANASRYAIIAEVRHVTPEIENLFCGPTKING
jgi:hypothetical protein